MSRSGGVAIARVKHIDPQEVRRQFQYNPETGVLTWKAREHDGNRQDENWNKRFAGKVAGSIRRNSPRPYVNVKFMGSDFGAHRLIWAWVTGNPPPWQIDHLDGDALNNSWENLRNGTGSINNRNSKLPKSNTSGFVGVVWGKQSLKWHAQVKIKGKNRFLGAFDEISEAAVVSREFRLKNGFSERHGQPSDDQKSV